MTDRRPTLLILRALGLGDLLTAVPALRALAEAFPDHRRVLAIPRPLWPIAGMTGAVDATVDARPFEPLPIERPALAVNLHGRGPESHRVLLATAPPRLLAFAHPEVAETAGSPPWVADEHEVARWCRLLRGVGIPADPSRLGLPPPDGRGRDDRLTVVHPGAASPARRWPVDRWVEVAAAEATQGQRVVVTGTPDEASLAERVVTGARLPVRSLLAGRTDVEALARLVHRAGLVLSGDTGVAHLATAFGTPSVVLFGPTSPAHWGPPANRPQHVTLWAGTRGDPHATTPDPGLLRIGVEDVLLAAARARAAGSSREPVDRRVPA